MGTGRRGTDWPPPASARIPSRRRREPSSRGCGRRAPRDRRQQRRGRQRAYRWSLASSFGPMFQHGVQPQHTIVHSKPPGSISSSNLLCLRTTQAPVKLKEFFFLPRQTLTRPPWRLTPATKRAETLRDLLSFPITASSALLRRVTGWGFSTFSAYLEELELLDVCCQDHAHSSLM